MKKVIFSCALVIVSFFSVQAQKSNDGFHFAGGLRLALPVGVFSDVSSFGIGVDLQGEYFFSPMVSATLTTGYTSFSGKTISDGFGNSFKISATGYVPVMVGVRVYPSEQFFIGARAGIGFLTGGGSGSGFNYEPQIGYNADKFQIAFGYNSISASGGGSLSHVNLTALYKFN